MARFWRGALLAANGVVLVGVVAFAAIAYKPGIDPVSPPAPSQFPAAQVARGAELAALGDCAVCHTAPGGPRLAGGRAVPTPFGTVYATNITPDPATGIGTWSEAAFRRAMQDGIAIDGSHLYPVLPYPHFIHANEDDVAAVYAYLMTRGPVAATAPANKLPFPLDQRIILAGWNLLFLRPGVWQPDPAHDAVWNRGDYLVEGVGHCGACHTPHNALGAEQTSDRLGGGQAEGWYAPPLDAHSPAPLAWTVAELESYLRTGFAEQHGAAGGPMTAVTQELARVPDADVTAIATYIASRMPPTPTTGTPSAPPAPDPAAQALFVGACGACHSDDAPMARAGLNTLADGTGLQAPTPMGVIQVILNGLPWREGQPSPYMPAYAPMLTDAQVAQLAAYLRARYTHEAAWTDLESEVAKARKDGGT